MNSILFIKLGAIGDVIQAAAAVYEFRSQAKGISIDWVIGQSIKSLLRSMGVADHVIAIPDQKLFTGSLFRKVVSLLQCWGILVKNCRQYDEIYVAHSNWQYWILAIPAFIRNPRLIVRPQKRFLPILTDYRVNEYFRFLTGTKITTINGANAMQNLGDRLLARDAKKFRLSQAITHVYDRAKDVNKNKKYIVLVPGGSKNLLRDDFLRRWPIHYYVELSRLLFHENHIIILVGSAEDEWVKPYFSDLEVIDLIGKTSLVELVDLFNEVNLIITHDTGPLHIAGLTRTPLITLFGPTPASAVVPNQRHNLKVFISNPNVLCAPCYDGKNYAKCENPRCMKSISVDAVFNASKSLLNGRESY